MKKAEIITAQTFNVDRNTKKNKFVRKLSVNGRIAIDQLVDYYKLEGLTRITNQIFDEDIELLSGSKLKKHYVTCINERAFFTHSNKQIGFKRLNVTTFVYPNLQAYKLTYPEWEKYRLVAMKRDHFACRMCGDKNALNVYPLKSHKSDLCPKSADELITLCKYCQKQVEKMLLDGIVPIYFVKI